MAIYTPQPAQRYHTKLRLALAGPPGSGKSLTALRFAGALGTRVCVIDADHGASELYAGRPDVPPFDVIVLQGEPDPDNYEAALDAATSYDVVVVDTISPEWTATLRLVDDITLTSLSQNGYTQGWRTATPKHDHFTRALITHPAHLIATVQQRIKYVLQDTPGVGLVPKKAGWKWVQRQMLELLFDLCCELDALHTLTVVKSRFDTLDHQQIQRPTAAWIEDHVKPALNLGKPTHSLQDLTAAVKAAGYGELDLKQAMARLTPGVTRFKDLTRAHLDVLYDYFTAMDTIPDTAQEA